MFIYIRFMPRVKTIKDAQVLEKTLDLLIVRGPHQLTLSEVGQAVSLSPSTLVQRFGSKDGLVQRTLEYATEQLERSIELMPDSGDARRDLIDWLITLASAFQTRDHVAGNLTLLIADLNDEQRRHSAARYTDAMRRGIERKLRALGSPLPTFYAKLIEAQWHGLVIQWAIHGQGGLESWMREGLSGLLDALGL